MREFLSSGQVGNIELNAQKQIRESIQNRWDSLGFTEGLNGAIKENVATLYENEAKHLIYEANITLTPEIDQDITKKNNYIPKSSKDNDM